MALQLASAAPTTIPASSNPRTHFAHQQPTPLSSAFSTPDTISPTSPNSDSVSPPGPYNNYARRQIRAPKTPMYTPAVLRPTESPAYWRALERGHSNLAAGLAVSQNCTITPPQSAGNSFDDPDGREGEAARRMLGETMVDGRISRVVTDEWKDARVEHVTGSPTRSHWKPDSHSIECESSTCDAIFSLVIRRHHCRRCGKIFCAQHSAHAVPLDQHATFHPRGELGRACDCCYADYRHWEKMRKSRNDSNGSSEAGSGSTTPVSLATPAGEKQKDDAKDGKTVFGSFCNRDWNWSTF